MNKKIKTTDLNLNVSTGTILYVDIDIFRFLYDSEIFCITVEVIDGENYEFLEEINLEKDRSNLDCNDLKIFALNWIFRNVEIVKEF
ncbi:ubiquitin [Clostridium sp. CTA-6]